MSDQEVTYEQVVSAAEAIVKKNERVTIERVRRLIGYGDMIKIVGFLRQWQKVKNNEKEQTGASHAKTARASVASDEVVVVVSGTETNQHRHRKNHAFSLERLQKEAVIIQALFWSLYQIRLEKNIAIEGSQLENKSINDMMVKAEDQIRKIKRTLKTEIAQLKQQYYKISLQYESERNKIR